MPPADAQLRRIALFLGLPDTAPKQAVTSAEDAIREAMAAGLAVSQGRPDDPLLDFLGL